MTELKNSGMSAANLQLSECCMLQGRLTVHVQEKKHECTIRINVRGKFIHCLNHYRTNWLGLPLFCWSHWHRMSIIQVLTSIPLKQTMVFAFCSNWIGVFMKLVPLPFYTAITIIFFYLPFVFSLAVTASLL